MISSIAPRENRVRRQYVSRGNNFCKAGLGQSRFRYAAFNPRHETR